MTLDMNPEIRAQWCAALRSGDYRQGAGYLRHATGAYCCLGVLCDLAVKAKVIPAATNPAGIWTFDGEHNFLPHLVVRWAGLAAIDPAVDRNGSRLALSSFNDEYGHTFAEIADLIDGGAS